jgi:hypothetical protein
MASLREKQLLSLVLIGALSASVLTLSGFIVSGGNGDGKDADPRHHSPSSHQSSNTAAASPYPIYIEKQFKKKVVDNQALYGIGSLRVYDDWVNAEISCEFCTRLEYTPGQLGVPEFAYVNGDNDTTQSLLSGAKKVSFYVKGDSGDEVVKFKAAGKPVVASSSSSSTAADAKNQPLLSPLSSPLQQQKDKDKNIKFDVVTKPVKLEKNWKKLEIDLTQKNLAGVVEPFAVEPDNSTKQGEKAGGGPPIVIYLKAVRYDDSPPENSLPEE